jgi:tetratricopeptide (TPR) repeat protein
MNEDQVAVVRRFLSDGVFKNGKESKEKQLFEKIISVKGQEISGVELSQHIYSSMPDDRYRKLVSRLQKKILEATCSEELMEKEHLVSFRDMTAIRLKRQILQCRALISTSNRYKMGIIAPMLENIIATSASEELFDTLTEALRLKRETCLATRTMFGIAELENDISTYERSQTLIEQARAIVYMSNCTPQHGPDQSEGASPTALTAMIIELKQAHEKTRSHSLNYFLNLLQIHQAEKGGNYKAAIEYCKEIIKTYSASKISFTASMLPECYLMLSRYYLLSLAYEESGNYARKAEELSKSYSHNYSVGLEYEFLSTYFLERFRKSLDILDRMEFAVPEGEKKLAARYAFYRACIYFRLGNYNDAYKQHYNASLLIKDKGGWAIGYKYLQIMLQAEFGNIDPAAASVDSLRKLLSRNEEIQLSDRDKLIICALRKLERKGFSKENIDPKVQSYVDQLSSTSSSIAWSPLSHELIPVHECIIDRGRNSRKKTYSLAS